MTLTDNQPKEKRNALNSLLVNRRLYAVQGAAGTSGADASQQAQII